MPCYLFTLHAYGSWYPDRPQGYVVRGQGILPSDAEEARRYRQRAAHAPATLEAAQQRAIIAQAVEAAAVLGCRLHFVATEPTHVHLLVSWSTQCTWACVRKSFKKALTIRLKGQLGKRPWFSENGSRKRVTDQDHFDYLVGKYLPDHSGWKWCEGRGEFL
ncbi:MAG: hypothetical protein KDA44_04925 [Planctomycetales bacterium]|nr:hypothetical protein [Planctomycetales bacterium]